MSVDGQTSCTEKMNKTSPATRRQLRGRVSGTPTEKDGGAKQAGNTDKDTPSSSPSRVKMRTRLSTGTLVMNGTSTVKEKNMKPSPSTPSDSPKTWKDNSGSKRRAAGSSGSSSESLAMVPPKLRKIVHKEGQEEGTERDEYCWLCHKDEAAISCFLCPRSFHLKCLNMSSVGKEWVCSDCGKIMQEECKNSCSKAVSQIIIDKLCLLLRYALDRMRQPGSEVFQKPVDSTVFPNYTDYIFHPMDFTTLEKNIRNKEYGCTDAFLADAKWILHNCIIFNGVHHKLTNVARNVVKSCQHEMSEIDVCPQCYERSCIYADGTWFVEPCDPPHILVWAKLKGYPFWPAKALQDMNDQVDVRFFGAHDMSWIPVSQVFLLSKENPTSTIKNRKGGFGAALKEMEEHVEILKAKFGDYDYAPYRTPYDRRSVYMNNKQKGISKKFKSAGFGKLPVRGKEVEKVSAVSKTASALKSKYSTMANKKSTSMQVQNYSHQGRPFTSIGLQTSSSCEPSPEKPPARPAQTTRIIMGREGGGFQAKQTARKSLTILNPVVSMRDIIENKILKLQELEDMDVEDCGDGKDDGGDVSKAFEETEVAGKADENDAEKSLAQSAGSGLVSSTEVSSDKGIKDMNKELLEREVGVGIVGEVERVEAEKVQHEERLVTDRCSPSQSVEGATKRSSSEQEMAAGKEAQVGIEKRKLEELPKSTEILPQEKINLPSFAAVSKSLSERPPSSEQEMSVRKEAQVGIEKRKLEELPKGTGILPQEKINLPSFPAVSKSLSEKPPSSEQEMSARKEAQVGIEKRKLEELPKSTEILPQEKINLPSFAAVSKSLSERPPSSEQEMSVRKEAQVGIEKRKLEELPKGTGILPQEKINLPSFPAVSKSLSEKPPSSEQEMSARKEAQVGIEKRKLEELPKSTGILPQEKINLLSFPAVSVSLSASELEKTAASEKTLLMETATQDIPTTSDTTTADSSGKDASIKPLSVVPMYPTTPSSATSSSSVPMELSPKSGVDYKHALLKTIEACKGKLGISEVADIEEINLDPSEDDDDDEEDDSGDNREGQSGSVKADGSGPPLEAADSAIVSAEAKQQPSTVPGQVSGLQSSLLDNITSSEGKPRSSPKPASESKPCEKNAELLQSVSKSLDQPVSSESSSLVITAPGKDALLESVSAVENLSGPGAGVTADDSVAVSSKPVSQSGSQSGSPSKLDPWPVSPNQNPVSPALSNQNTVSPVSSNQNPVSPSLSNQNTVSPVSSNQNTCSTTILLQTLKETTTRVKTDSVTTVSSSKPATVVYPSHSATSKQGAGKSLLSGNGATRVRPITIEDDDDEPGLLMEVEEDEDSLIIDLDEDDLDLTAGGAGSTKSGNFVRELTPSPSLVKSVLRRSQVNILRSGSKKQKNPESDGAAPASSTSSTASTPSPSSASSAPCVLVDVRSLSGMDHEWGASETSPQEQARSQPVAQAPSQGQRQAQAQDQGQASAEPRAGQPMTSPYPSAYTFHFKRPAAPSATPARPAPTTSAATSATTTSAPTNASSRSNQRSRPRSSSREGERSEKPSLTAAAVSLVNKYSQQLMSNTQIQLAEMCREMLSSGPSEEENEQRLQEQRDQLQWTHEKQVAEIHHNFKMMIAERKACWEAEKSKAISDLKKKLTKEKEDAVAETKKKQWCAHCWKEALYYCCWNTTYCSYTCQQSHWAIHQDTCRQVVESTAATTATTTTEPTATSAEGMTAATVGSTKDKEAESVGSSSNNGLSLSEAEERIKAQTFNLQKPSSGPDMSSQGDDSWRGQLPLPTQTLGMGQSIHFLPAQQPAPPSSQPLQQLQYLHSIGPTGHTTFQTNSQVQLLSQRPTLNTMLPAGTVMPGNAMVFPILRNSQPGTLQGQHNVILNRPMHYQPIWKNC